MTDSTRYLPNEQDISALCHASGALLASGHEELSDRLWALKCKLRAQQSLDEGNVEGAEFHFNESPLNAEVPNVQV
jgi:hypothetical protein